MPAPRLQHAGALAPGRIIRWSIGSGKELLKDAEDPTVYTIHVEAQGPYGEIEPTEVDVRLSDWREARDAPDGSLHHVRGEIKKLTDAVQSLRGLTSRDSSDRP